MRLLDDNAIRAELEKLTGWQRQDNAIAKTYEYKDFAAALSFVNHVGGLAESVNHHPDIDIRWNKVTLVLFTHYLGGLTEKDFQLAARIESTLAT